MSQRVLARSDVSSTGAVLTAAREELNLSVADVAQSLKLTPAQVEALEEGAYHRLPGRVFVRGFLRNYAKLLGVDPQPLLRRIEHEMPQPKVVAEPPPSPEAVMPTGERSRMPLYGGIAATAIAALAAYEFGFNNPPEPEPTPATPAAQKEARVETPAPVPQAAPAASAAAVAPAPSAGAAIASGMPLNTALGTSSAGTGNAGPGQRMLLFRFEQESWVEIRDRDDKIIFSKLNRAGAEERVAGSPPLKLVVGNARGVRLNYGETLVDLTPHIGVTVARLTLQ